MSITVTIFQANNEENTKALDCCAFLREIMGDQWIAPTRASDVESVFMS